jgi:hypothetical protein
MSLDKEITMYRRRIPANSLIEYILPIAVVGVGVMVAITLFQPVMMEGVLGKVSAKPGSLKNAGAEIRKLGENPALRTLNITLADGTRIYVPEYPADMALAIETQGVDGTTELLIANLRSIARQLRDAEKITQAEFANFEALANQGHQLARIQKILADASLANDTDIFSYKYQVDGQHYNLLELSWLISDSGLPQNQVDQNLGNRTLVTDFPSDKMKSMFNLTGIQLYRFKALYAQANASKAMADPALQKVISALSLNINHLSNETGHNSNSVMAGDLSPAQFNGKIASAMTHASSAHICTSSGPNAEDSGIHCSVN